MEGSSINTSTQQRHMTPKCLEEELPLQPPPSINCKNLDLLGDAKFVNIVFEKSSRAFFRISDHNNKDICLIQDHQATDFQTQIGIKYLECIDEKQTCVLYITYPVGLGTVTILSPQEEVLGECQSNVEFVCLSVKVKYNYYDAAGKRLLKMSAMVPEDKEDTKFTLIVKGQNKEKLARIQMGSLKSCCHVDFKSSQVSILQRLQIISLWAGFMYNELEDSEAMGLIERRNSQMQREKETRRSSRAKYFSLRRNTKTDNKVDGEKSEEIKSFDSQWKKNSDNDSCDKSTQLVNSKSWKKLVPQFSRGNNRLQTDYNFRERTNNNSQTVNTRGVDELR